MADSGESLRMTPRPISGGSTTEAELGVPGVAWPARVARSESPLAQGVRRFRRSTTALVGAAIVVETLFAMPGLGTFGIDAIIARDYQQVQGFALITAFAFVVINLIVDLTYTFLDPRIRYT